MNFASFDLNLLRVFDALMRERSATRAGQTIGLSQPAVSNALGRLRLTLKDELFIRRGNDMVPTPFAESLAGAVRDALAQIEQALAGDDSFDPSSAERLFTLYGADFFSSLTMPPLFARVAACAPGVALRLLESATGEVERLLRDNVIDAALERRMPMPDWVSSQSVLLSSFVVVAARDNAEIAATGVKSGDTLPLALFCRLPHALRSVDGSMSGMVDEALHEAGLARRVMLALPHFHSVAVAVARSNLIAALPRQMAAAIAEHLGLAIYRLPVDVPAQELHLYWHRRHDRHPAHCWLRQQVVEVVGTITERPA
ncbi:LysR family transcriptional regulator [Nitratireductor sp. CAU 1489]|uniref:LysR family transcriptional regulator n=1 Tax=Nitratireductor arenosus TaxID=2682096 RepID=A0A844QNA4_9HYPH|nr:LysR family transcriptional regulator [Nitratireductor arenosus]MVA99443.1 LysR family transcriptional regulator [Nitratireductor arenosus]